MTRILGRFSGRRRVVAASFLSILLLGGVVLQAEEVSAAKSWGYDLAHELMSPFCPGRTLATCPSPQASELVQWIVTQEAAGVTREQVIEILIERHGEEILGAPPAEGIMLWAYVFPVAGFLAGGGLAFFVLRRIVRTKRVSDVDPVAAGSGNADDELARIVDAELASRS